MAQIDLGKLKFTWKGTWSTASAYEVDDVVYYLGSAYICIADASNTTNSPEQNSTNWTRMSSGLNYRGTFTTPTGYTWYYGDIVTYQNTAYFHSLGTSVGYTPGSTQSGNPWQVLASGTGGAYTSAGDIEYRDNDSSNSALSIGIENSVLSVEKNPRESFPNNTTAVYEQIQLPGATPATNGKSAYLFRDDHPTVETVTYTVTVAAGKFVINGTSQLALTLKTGSTYTFDVSDSTNNGHVLAFNARTGASNTTFDFETAAIADGVTHSGTPGTSGATVTWTVPHLGFLVYEYYCTNHSGMGAGITWTSSTKIAGRLLHSDAHPNIDLTRTNIYSFTFPTATGMSYSVKDPGLSNYNTIGINGRITAGVSPVNVTGGTITFTPSTTVDGSLIIRDEGGSTDQIFITLHSMFFKPVWKGEGSTYKNKIPQPEDTRFNDPTYRVFANSSVNVHTESIAPLPDYLKKSGRGFQYGTVKPGYRQGGLITDRHYNFWGNMYHNSSQGYYYGAGIGTGCTTYNGTFDTPWTSNWRSPKVWEECLAGKSEYAHFLTDVNGTDLGYLDADGNQLVVKPRLKQVHRGNTNAWYLYENGMVTFAGYGGYGSFGQGRTDSQYIECMGVFHDESGTLLDGANYPKIKQMEFTSAHMGDHGAQSYYSVYFVDTNGFLYTMGYNGYGQLGNNTTTSNYYIKRMAKSNFGGADILYVHTSGYYYTSTYAIDSNGDLWGWGRNNYGQLGLGNTTQQTTPQKITGVTGSDLLNKKVIHIQATQDGDDIGKCHVLTTEGKVYFMGYLQDYGMWVGYYDSGNSSTHSLPRLLTNSADLWNSDSQKVEYMATMGTRYNTYYFITDGGSTGLEQKLYATGGNTTGQQGTGSSNSTSQGSSQQGWWFGKEIQFRDWGREYKGQTNNNYVEEAYGNWASWQTGGTNANKMKIGRIVEIYPAAHSSESYNRCVMIDEHGRIFFAGYWSYDMSCNWEMNNSTSMITGPMYQSEKTLTGSPSTSQDVEWTSYFGWLSSLNGFVKPGGFCHMGNSYSENGWQVVTKDGTLYIGGNDSWNQSGFAQGAHHGFWEYQYRLGGH